MPLLFNQDKVLKPTQDLYLNSNADGYRLREKTLKPTQDLYLNMAEAINNVTKNILKPTQDLYLNFPKDGAVLYNNTAQTDTRFVFKQKS